MRVVGYADVDRELWDRIASTSPESWLTHRSQWIEIEQRFFVHSNLSFALVEGKETVGIQPLFLNDRTGMIFGERLIHCGIHRHTGLALAPDLAPSLAAAARQFAMMQIMSLAELYDADRIQLNCHNLSPFNRSDRREDIPFWVRDFGFQLGLFFGPHQMMPCPGLSTVNADQIVDLTRSEDELFANLQDRNSVRRAMSEGLEFEITNDLSALEDYAAIATISAQRTGEELPSFDYYRAILKAFAADGHCYIAFARNREGRQAALILLIDRGAANYLAGVSLTDALKLRPNDFLHWNAMLWAKNEGITAYRFGPFFPEVPTDWPIARVSKFKTKFGARSIPIIQGSFFRKPELYTKQIDGLLQNVRDVARMPIAQPDMDTSGRDVVSHHLQLFGFADVNNASSGVSVLHRPTKLEIPAAQAGSKLGKVVVAVLPSVEFAREFGVTIKAKTIRSPQVLHANPTLPGHGKRLRTLHSFMTFAAPDGTPIVSDKGDVVWLLKATEAGHILFIGTDLGGDLVRYRQGDPAAADRRPTDARWGFAGERPNYLFEPQLAGEDLNERPADWWCEVLAEALQQFCGIGRSPILPNNAPGAIVITGDDDQAALSCYAQQREALGNLPVTYFLHPLTKHDAKSLDQLKKGRRLELGLHPDALDRPRDYDRLFADQSAWFKRLTGQDVYNVRNHGFLNDGYWGHARSWTAHGATGSSNLPGLDGRVLNGSLLPARLMLNDQLTDHWSILAAIGDGVVFINGWDDEQSSKCVLDLADRIRSSGVPGVMVLNLHPENIGKTQGMHKAAREIVESGFVAWTLDECFEWFGSRGGPSSKRSHSR